MNGFVVSWVRGLTGAGLVWLLSASVAAAQTGVINQTATATRRVILRSVPSTTGDPLETLVAQDTVRVFDGPQSGYYHVQASDGQVGWVWSKSVKLAPGVVPMNTPTTPGSGPTTAAHVDVSNCSAELWAHTYHPARLQLHDECVTVTGTIQDATATQSHHQADGMRHESDGDTHGWLKLDPQFEWMLDPGNADEGGNLVFEVICHYPISGTSTAAQSACGAFQDSQTLPSVNAHVAITGRFVLDTNHAHWNEIHPVTSIKVQ
ncbi:MAG TPA: SH3 domain-containing protein [Vicinamibacterales bacterium]|jgi:hypothetical protein|nr:SH3 domain-containing protein [Vicinamibacterales bacterium]